MMYSKNSNSVLLRLDPGDEIIESIIKVANEANITTATVSGIGATDNFEIGIFNLETKQYDTHAFNGNHEITNLCGSISIMDNKPYQHIHITCANNKGQCVGGHLLKAIVSLTCEIFIHYTNNPITRKANKNLGINQWQFPNA